MLNGEQKEKERIICNYLHYIVSDICHTICIKTREDSFPQEQFININISTLEAASKRLSNLQKNKKQNFEKIHVLCEEEVETAEGL